MHLEILRHDGPARLGKLHHNGLMALTPGLLWSPAAGPSPEDFITLSPPGFIHDKTTLITYGTIFGGEKIKDFGLLPSFPSGYDTPKEISDKAVKTTLKISEENPGFGAVIEGGRFIDLRQLSAEYLKDRPILKIANADKLSKNHRKLVEVTVSIREIVSPNTALYMSDIPPVMFPILAYLGVDLFDFKKGVLGAHEGLYLTQRGVLKADSLAEFPCSCMVCGERKKELEFPELLRHNIYSLIAAIIEVRESIRTGNLRNLVEERCACDVNAMGALRILDFEKHEFLERYTPISKSS